MTARPTMDRPALSADGAARALRLGWGLVANLRPLEGERDLNFQVIHDSKPFAVLKVVHPDEPESALTMQSAMLDHLQQHAPSLTCPHLHRTTAGAATLEDNGLRFRLVSWCEGTPLAERGRDPQTLRAVGRLIGEVTNALQSFGHPGAHRDLVWDIRRSGESANRLAHIPPERRSVIARAIARFEAVQGPASRVRHAVVHGDLNDWNLLVTPDGSLGIIDVGDASHGPAIADLAIGATYAVMGTEAPLLSLIEVVAGYASARSIDDAELACLPGLIFGRLATSLTIAAERRTAAPPTTGDAYWFVSESGAWHLLEQLDRMQPAHLLGALRQAAGKSASPAFQAFQGFLESRPALHPILGRPLAQQAVQRLFWRSVDDPMVPETIAGDLAGADAAYEAHRQASGFEVGVGSWGERRAVYASPAFASVLIPGTRRDMHLGLDLFAPAHTPLFTPLAGRVVRTADCNRPQDYGGVLLLSHDLPAGGEFQTLWGHLDPRSIEHLKPGDHLAAGACVARLGDSTVNGGWVPHLHLQLCLGDELDPEAIVGVGESALEGLWRELYPDPLILAGLPPEVLSYSRSAAEETRARRERHFGTNLKLSYRTPLEIVRGEDVWLIDARGRSYLDCYNNVAHVGHCHPRVVEAITRQVRVLNTNTRYLHRLAGEYAERLTATFPAPLDTVFFTNSGSEANELALRMARTITGRREVAVLDWAYHGNTQSVIEVSPYKYKRSGGSGRPSFVIEVPCPDAYRAPGSWPTDQVGHRFANHLEAAIASAAKPAAFIAETIPSCAGQLVLPQGFLSRAFELVRGAGGLCIADEVQVGFGRVGAHMWAFEEHGVVPDIVTLGKPMGNGHPLGAVVTSREVARQFANGMEYFNTFGGNPVSCAAGLAVLDVIEEEHLRDNAATEGAAIIQALRSLQPENPSIGDVRGRGLFLGIDLVTDPESKAPATVLAAEVVEGCLRSGILIGTDGPHDNVIKLRPPMTFRPAHRELLLEILTEALSTATRAGRAASRG